jgi:RimJ/RimL family protein N-acetyltransferase
MAAHLPALLTSDIRLRHVTEDDLPIFFEHQWDPDANQMAAFLPRDEAAFMAHWKKILADPTAPVRTILFGGHVAGNVVSWVRDGKQLVGYWIGKAYWGKGVATQALSQFLGVVEARPLFAHVAKRNLASIRVLEKCGFTICVEATESLDPPSDGVEELVFQLSTNGDGDVH